MAVGGIASTTVQLYSSVLATSSNALVTSSFLLLVVMPGATSSVLVTRVHKLEYYVFSLS